MVQLYLYSKLLASIVLFIYGLRLLSYNLLEVFELPLFRLFRDSKGSSYKSMLKGFALGAPSLECHKLTSSVGGMVQAGLLSQRHALVVTSFGQIFSVFGLVLALLIPLDKGIVMMGFAIVPLLLARGKWEEVFRNLAFVLIGIGIISFAQALMYEGVLVIQQHHEIIRFLNNSVIVSVISGTIIGFLCLLIFEKDTILLVLFFKLGILFPHDQHVFLVALSIPIIGCSLGFWPLANKSNIYGKRFFKVLILSEVVLLAFFIPIMLRFPEIFSNPLVFIFLVISFRFIKYLAIISAHSFLSKIALKLFPQQGHRENFQLGVLGDSRNISPPLALIQAGFHLAKLQSVIVRMFDLVQSYVTTDYHARNLAKIKDYERIIDNMQEEIHFYLRGVSEKELTSHQAFTLQKLMLQSQQLETISDYLDKIASYLTAFLESGEKFDSMEGSVLTYFQEVSEFFTKVSSTLPLKTEDDQAISELNRSIKLKGIGLKQDLGELIDGQQVSNNGVFMLSDLFNAIKKVRSHSLRLFNNLL